jgi:hypothetical protein
MALIKDKSQILGAINLPTEDVYVPEWKATVRLRGLTGIERDKYEESCVKMRGGVQQANISNATSRLVAWCMVDESGSKLFYGEDDVKELGKQPASAIQRCFTVACRLSGLTEDDINELTEGFDDAPNDASTSD